MKGKVTEGEDAFVKVLDFLDGKTPESTKFSSNLGDLFNSVKYNLFMIILLLFAVAVALVVLTPFLLGSEDPTLRGFGAIIQVLVGLSSGCHQLPYRTLIFDGIPQPVCSRDVGIYVGALLGFATVLYAKTPKLLSETKSLVIAFAPIALDGASQTILHLRESNDAIRLSTGLIFAFFLIGFLAQRFFNPRYPGFREKVLDLRFLLVDLLIVALIVYKISPLAYGFGLTYMSRGEAVSAALSNSSITHPAIVKSYFIAPLAPFSIQYDPFYVNHDDILLKDLEEMPYYNTTPCSNASSCGQPPLLFSDSYGNLSADNMLFTMAEREHNLGLWAVAVLEGTPSGTDPYIKSGTGEYYFFDAYTHRLLAKKNH
ncbi:MAG: DUF2085 domain-containing protein [Candidatus Altiarchaeota archaeon]|nr:DUF2085 domain-containing protein [Candidatus Altiarchaeota archaeon]